MTSEAATPNFPAAGLRAPSGVTWAEGSEQHEVREESEEEDSTADAADAEKQLLAALPARALEQSLFNLDGAWGVQQQLPGALGRETTLLRYRLDLRHQPPRVEGGGLVPPSAAWPGWMRAAVTGESCAAGPLVRFSLCIDPTEPSPCRTRRGVSWRAECTAMIDETGNYFAGSYRAVTAEPGKSRIVCGALSAARLPAGAEDIGWPPRPCGPAQPMICGDAPPAVCDRPDAEQ
eukprot:TRINITY_DN4607_c0_g3_i1.p1 TRINITY_DN4607_c0_g3~~TRINITY_DN4607_c0_g3_i1.p1  ORF type:complete len:262 (+),score=79.11 TRINITY_DN4607_c0_g3_i1:86-787(+)